MRRERERERERERKDEDENKDEKGEAPTLNGEKHKSLTIARCPTRAGTSDFITDHGSQLSGWFVHHSRTWAARERFTQSRVYLGTAISGGLSSQRGGHADGRSRQGVKNHRQQRGHGGER